MAAIIPSDYLHGGMGPWLVNAQCNQPQATLQEKHIPHRRWWILENQDTVLTAAG